MKRTRRKQPFLLPSPLILLDHWEDPAAAAAAAAVSAAFNTLEGIAVGASGSGGGGVPKQITSQQSYHHPNKRRGRRITISIHTFLFPFLSLILLRVYAVALSITLPTPLRRLFAFCTKRGPIVRECNISPSNEKKKKKMNQVEHFRLPPGFSRNGIGSRNKILLLLLLLLPLRKKREIWKSPRPFLSSSFSVPFQSEIYVFFFTHRRQQPAPTVVVVVVVFVVTAILKCIWNNKKKDLI